jgi:protein-tyrosine phosphatase
VLFVCTGNICRSPTAHALLLHKARLAGLPCEVDSAAISAEEGGKPPDPRAVAEATRRGIAMPAHRARQVTVRDLARFDWVIGMTHAHVVALRRLAGMASLDKVHLLRRFAATDQARDIPDPWYGDAAAFAEAFDLIDDAVEGLLAHLQADARVDAPA